VRFARMGTISIMVSALSACLAALPVTPTTRPSAISALRVLMRIMALAFLAVRGAHLAPPTKPVTHALSATKWWKMHV
jgi:hypothetical protein